ncbi:MAG: hypothetical protein IT289_01010 [Oligoflexia bacterium]|nr:hypothetical protein [Oligoflexia bacterium]
MKSLSLFLLGLVLTAGCFNSPVPSGLNSSPQFPPSENNQVALTQTAAADIACGIHIEWPKHELVGVDIKAEIADKKVTVLLDVSNKLGQEVIVRIAKPAALSYLSFESSAPDRLAFESLDASQEVGLHVSALSEGRAALNLETKDLCPE